MDPALILQSTQWCHRFRGHNFGVVRESALATGVLKWSVPGQSHSDQWSIKSMIKMLRDIQVILKNVS